MDALQMDCSCPGSWKYVLMKCGMLSHQGCDKLGFTAEKTFTVRFTGHLYPLMCQKLTVFKKKGCVLKNNANPLNHESVLMLYVLVSLALRVSQYLYSVLV